MDLIRRIAWGFAAALFFVTLTNYVPGLTDSQGRAFGIFALDIYDDALHFASALWAAIAAYTSRNAAVTFLKVFGTLYFLDGLMGLLVGSGYLDLGIFLQGRQPLPWMFKIYANTPHLLLGAIGIFSGFFLAKRS
jgi:uncharacterized membrane protein